MKTRKAFTLVELLIVLVIIGVLASMLALGAGAGTDTAEAAAVISDLRTLRAAFMMIHADNYFNKEKLKSLFNTGLTATLREELSKYIDNPDALNKVKDIAVILGSPLRISYDVSDRSNAAKTRLAAAAQAQKLYSYDILTGTDRTDITKYGYKGPNRGTHPNLVCVFVPLFSR